MPMIQQSLNLKNNPNDTPPQIKIIGANHNDSSEEAQKHSLDNYVKVTLGGGNDVLASTKNTTKQHSTKQ